jgi:hypothetical protein
MLPVQKSPLLPPLLLLELDGDDLEERDAEELYKVNGGVNQAWRCCVMYAETSRAFIGARYGYL